MAKGLEMPINMLVAIAVAVIIMIGVVMLIGPQLGIFGGGVNMESLKAQKCGAFVRAGCIANDTSGHFGCEAVSIGVDVNGDGKSDNLLTLTQKYSGDTALDNAGCARVCGCP